MSTKALFPPNRSQRSNVRSLCVQRRINLRATVDIIEELDRESRKFTDLVLAVSVQEATQLIAPTDDNRLKALDDAVANGGLPICFVGYTVEGERNTIRFYARILPDCDDRDLGVQTVADLSSLFLQGMAQVFGSNETKTEHGTE